jgi:hypothetical protein
VAVGAGVDGDMLGCEARFGGDRLDGNFRGTTRDGGAKRNNQTHGQVVAFHMRLPQ